MSKCGIKECRNYADVDVYFDVGEDIAVCSAHAGERFWTSPNAIQIVPRHGGECNQPYKDPNCGKRVRVTIDAVVVGPYLHHKTKEVIGYHVKMKLGRDRPYVNTMVPLKDIEKLGLVV